MEDIEFDLAMDRLLEGSACSSWSGLAEFLDVTPAAVGQARRIKKSIPANWLLTLLHKRMVNPDWVLGESSAKYLQEKKPTPKELLTDLVHMHAAIS